MFRLMLKDNHSYCSDRFHLIFGSFFTLMRLNITDSYACNNNKFDLRNRAFLVILVYTEKCR